MKHNRFFRILVAAVVLSLLMIAIPVTPALGVTPAVTITSPVTASGPPGMAVTLNCTGFALTNLNYTVSFGGTVITSGSTGTTGAFTASFTVPTRARSNYTVTVTTTTPETASVLGGFTITPEITALTTSPFHVGDTVTVTGNGFAANSTSITIYFDGTNNVDTATTDGAGVLSGASFTVPACTQGNHTVKGTDASGSSPNFTFTVSPKITISPTSGAVGDTVTVSGTGFAAGSPTVTIYFDTTAMTTAATNSSGTFPSTTFAVPSSSRGSHIIKAQDASSNQATATFTVGQKITINPTSGPSGTPVTVIGNGFAASQTITIKYNGTAVVTTPSPVTTGSTGGFTAQFNVPVLAAGPYVVEASDTSANSATANFVSTTSATILPVTTTSSPGYVGMSLTITGVGFMPSHAVTVTYAISATETDTRTTVNSDASGNFAALFTIPPSIAGPHVITVSDTVITKTFDFIMESNPPPIPALVLPLVDTKLKDGEFDWGEVTDPEPSSGPVTYSLQVAPDADFTTILVYKTGLTTSAYTLLDTEKLESTGKDEPYYWHVRAVDAASNEGAWSEASTFTVGFSFEFTGWVVWVIMAVIALVFFIIGVWVGKRSGGGGGYY